MDCSAVAASGLVIGADDVTLDLNGHAIAGPGDGGFYDGIENSDGYANLTVKDGTIENYRIGVFTENAADNTFSHIHVISQGAFVDIGMETDYSLRTRFLHSRVNHSGAGTSFYFYYSAQSLLKDSVASDSDQAIYEDFGTKNHFIGNSQASPRSTSVGVYDSNSSRDLYRDNRFNDGATGFTIDYPTATRLLENIANGNSSNGFEFADNYSPNSVTASRNHANRNSKWGFYASYPVLGAHNHARNNGIQNCLIVACD